MSEVEGPKSVTGNRGLMLPPPLPARPPKRTREQKVLDEDEWTEKLEAIVQRDYFPDIPKLENELEWLEVSDDLIAKKPAISLQVPTSDGARWLNIYSEWMPYKQKWLFWKEGWGC